MCLPFSYIYIYMYVYIYIYIYIYTPRHGHFEPRGPQTASEISQTEIMRPDRRHPLV